MPTFAQLEKLVFVLTFVCAVALVRLYHLNDRGIQVDWPATFQSIANAAQTIAFCVGGWWTYLIFIKKRTDEKRGDLSIKILSFDFDASHTQLRVDLQIRNVGEVELTPGKARLEIRALRERGLPTRWPSDDDDPSVDAHLLVHRWPIVEQCDIPFVRDELTIEPGETETHPLDFLVSSSLDVLQVHVLVHYSAGLQPRIWDETVIYRVPLSSAEQRAISQSDARIQDPEALDRSN